MYIQNLSHKKQWAQSGGNAVSHYLYSRSFLLFIGEGLTSFPFHQLMENLSLYSLLVHKKVFLWCQIVFWFCNTIYNIHESEMTLSQRSKTNSCSYSLLPGSHSGQAFAPWLTQLSLSHSMRSLATVGLCSAYLPFVTMFHSPGEKK